MRSAIASACRRSSFPLATARRLNSPGSAARAPAAISASNASAGTSDPPCVVSSIVSSPVNERGATCTLAITRSIVAAEPGVCSEVR